MWRKGEIDPVGRGGGGYFGGRGTAVGENENGNQGGGAGKPG